MYAWCSDPVKYAMYVENRTHIHYNSLYPINIVWALCRQYWNVNWSTVLYKRLVSCQYTVLTYWKQDLMFRGKRSFIREKHDIGPLFKMLYIGSTPNIYIHVVLWWPAAKLYYNSYSCSEELVNVAIRYSIVQFSPCEPIFNPKKEKYCLHIYYMHEYCSELT